MQRHPDPNPGNPEGQVLHERRAVVLKQPNESLLPGAGGRRAFLPPQSEGITLPKYPVANRNHASVGAPKQTSSGISSPNRRLTFSAKLRKLPKPVNDQEPDQDQRIRAGKESPARQAAQFESAVSRCGRLQLRLGAARRRWFPTHR